jgi:hypothetical protein
MANLAAAGDAVNADRLASTAIAVHETASGIPPSAQRYNPDNADTDFWAPAVQTPVASRGHRSQRRQPSRPRSANAHNELGGACSSRADGPTRSNIGSRRLAPADDRFASPEESRHRGPVAEAWKISKAGLNPDNADAHNELGVLLFFAEQIAEDRPFASIGRAESDSVIARSDLGGALAQAGQFDQAANTCPCVALIGLHPARKTQTGPEPDGRNLSRDPSSTTAIAVSPSTGMMRTDRGSAR